MKYFRSYYFTAVLLFCCNYSSSAQQIVEVGMGEYFTSYRLSNGDLKAVKWGGQVPAVYDCGLSNVIDIDGAQYNNIALTATGNVYLVGVNNSVSPYVTHVATDYQGNPFTENTKVYGFYQCYLTLRNGNIWYWGIGDILYINNGVNIPAPIPLQQPAGKSFVKLVCGSATTFGAYTYLYGLASDGTVWQWDRTHSVPLQLQFPGNIAQDITQVGPFCIVIKTADNLYSFGADSRYVGGQSYWVNPSVQSIKSVWETAGCVFPLKEMQGNYNTLHVIDANDNMFASGANPQGEIGNGIEFSPWKNAPVPWQWDFGNAQLLTGPVQIPGKFKNICAGNTIAFYLYVQDLQDNWYSWGRNKALCLGNGKTLSINDYAIYPEAMNVPAPVLVTPLSQTWSVLPFNPTAQPLPFAHAGVNQYIVSSSTTLVGSGSWQQDGSLISYQWTKISGNGGLLISPNSINTQVTGLLAGTYVFRLTVVNNNSVSASADVTVVVNTTNQRPVVDAGIDQTINLPQVTAMLSGTASDADGTIASVRWVQLSGPSSATISKPDSLQTGISQLVEGMYTFVLKVTDNNNAATTDTMHLIVLPALVQSPIADAGGNVLFPFSTTVFVQGNGYDALGSITAYQWQLLEGVNSPLLINSNSSLLVLRNVIPGVYKLKLTVTNNRGLTDSDTALIKITSPWEKKPDEINVFPNPAHQNITVTIPAEERVAVGLIMISDEKGSIVYKNIVTQQTNLSLCTLALGNLLKGVYTILFISDSGKRFSRKILKL